MAPGGLASRAWTRGLAPLTSVRYKVVAATYRAHTQYPPAESVLKSAGRYTEYDSEELGPLSARSQDMS